MSKSVDFYYDYGSPAAYLAWTQMDRIAAATGATVNRLPVVLGAVFKATGNSAPITVPLKGRYLFTDLKRWAAHWGVALKFNPNFPINTINLMKLAHGVKLRQPEKLAALDAAVFRAIWVDALNLNDAAVCSDMLAAAGFPADEVSALIADDEVRAGVRAVTEEAVARGMFGAPTFFVNGEMYWGQDRLFMVEAALAAA